MAYIVIVMSTDKLPYDPTFLHARREGLIIFAVWILALLWAVPYCYTKGYGLDVAALETIWGVPVWVFWGIVVPWMLANIFTFWFCLFYMADDDLGEGDEA